MGINENDLTFVRCSSCSCLIPAIASRCRMCGQNLEESDSNQESTNKEEDSSKSRIRQRVATNHEGIESQKQDVPQVKDKSSVYESKRLEETDKENFSSAFDEIFVDDKPASSKTLKTGVQAEPESKSVDSAKSLEENKLDDKTSKIDDFFSETSASVSKNSKSGAEEIISKEPVSEEKISIQKEKPSISTNAAFAKKPNPKKVNTTKQNPQKLDNNNQKNKSEKKQSNQDAFSKSKKAKAPSLQSGDVNKEFRWESVKDEPSSESQVDQNIKTNKVGLSQSTLSPSKNKEKTVQEEKSKKQRFSKGKTMQQGKKESNLVGWFVDFEKPFGSAIELREGRFFVSSEVVKGEDLVIDHPSLSVPHCILKAHPTNGLRVQDLMSDKGTHIKKSNEHEYRQIEDSVAVEHGDWLKLGEYEVMVCVIPAFERSSEKDSKDED